jgi:Mn-dependent DtxR family transcriptional regulator
MVVVATFLYFIAVIFAPSKGLLFKYIRKQKLQKKITKEDILQSSLKLKRKGRITVAALSEKLNISPSRIKRLINELSTKKMLSLEGNEIKLSKTGTKKATELVRAHRLWETFLVNKMGLKEGQIHEDAHKFEHLLTEDLLDEIDADLDFPKRDPHGSPIPSKVGYPDYPLAQLKSDSLFMISQEQVNDQIMSELWELGLLPDTELSIKSKNKEKIVVDQKGNEIQIPLGLAKMINTKN